MSVPSDYAFFYSNKILFGELLIVYALSITTFDTFGHDKYISYVKYIDNFMVIPQNISPPVRTPHKQGWA